MTGFSVPKKKMKLSVDRHRVRRLMVECWRLQKHELYAVIPQEQQYHLFILHTNTTIPDYADVHRATTEGIARLKKMAQNDVL
jgi:ribonuclease P protein component